MAQTYSDLVSSVRDWANRDTEVLSDNIIQTSLTWAADNAYRELMVPPLEYTQEYVLYGEAQGTDTTLAAEDAGQALIENENGVYSTARLAIPADLSTFIHIRIVGAGERNADDTGWEVQSNGCLERTASNLRNIIVFNEKTDTRTLFDSSAVKISEFFWTRQQNDIVLAGRLQPGDIIEVYYYRRLPSLDARYALQQSDFTLDAGAVSATNTFVDGTIGPYDTVPTGADFTALNLGPNITAEDFFQPNLTPDADTPTLGQFYLGVPIDHWMREQNERILIFGALVEVFSYLQEDDQAQKYFVKYQAEVMRLNDEEKKRRASGGNVQVHYNSYLI